MAAILAADYFLIKRRRIDVPAMYDPHGRYRYAKGWNWRAFAALLIAIAPNLPGMINAIQPKIKIGKIRYVYLVSNIWGATSKCIDRHASRALLTKPVAVAVLYILSRLFPNPEAIIDAPIIDLDDVIDPETSYNAGFAGDEKSQETEKSMDVMVREV